MPDKVIEPLKKGDVVFCKYSTFGICVSDPYHDKFERRRQYAYWLEHHHKTLSLSGELIKIRLLMYDRKKEKIVLKPKIYTYPCEKIVKGMRWSVRFIRKHHLTGDIVKQLVKE